jgi:hypothetical protein
MSWYLFKNGHKVCEASDVEWGGGDPEYADTSTLGGGEGRTLVRVSATTVTFRVTAAFALGNPLTTEWELRDSAGNRVAIQMRHKGTDGWVDAFVSPPATQV